MFSLGPGDPFSGFPARIFPDQPSGFAEIWAAYYDSMAELARHILKAFALALDLPDENYFDEFVDHHASAMRFGLVENSTMVLPYSAKSSC